MEKNTPRRKKKFVPTAFKFMMAAGSLAGTLGIWNVLAKQDLTQASAQNLIIPGAPVSNEPMPTVAPLILITSSAGSNQVVIPTAAPIRDVTVNTAPQTTAPLNGSVISLPPSSAPAPITTTQSSKKP
jgi:hypothetical protein